MANTLKFGNGQWATKVGSTLAYNDEGGNFKPLPFNFTRSTSATRVNKDGLIEVVTNNKPRIDFLNDSNGALLLEPSRTNSLLQSNQFDTTWTTTNATVLGGQSGIYGSSDAWKLSENTVNSVHILLQNTISISNYTFSIYLKKGTKNKVMLFDGTNNEGAKFNLETQSFHSYYTSQINYKIEILSDGWARYSINMSNASSSFRIYMLDDNYNIAYGGNIENYIYIQYAQLEAGSYATSYIPTQGATATRVAESCTNGANDQVINSTEGVLYFEGSSIANDGTFKRISIGTSDNLFANSIQLRYNTDDNSITYQFRVGNVYQADLTITANTTNVNKIACVWKINRFEIWVNGVKEAQDTSGSVPSANTFNSLFFGKTSTLLEEPFRGNVKDIRVYNQALTDQELINLTTI